MRAILSLSAFVTLAGAGTMPAEVQDKKDSPYTTTVTYREWVKGQKMFLKPIEGIAAYPAKSKDAQDKWVLKRNDVPRIITPDSEITDADGKVWVVTKVTGGGTGGDDHILYVKPKP